MKYVRMPSMGHGMYEIPVEAITFQDEHAAFLPNAWPEFFCCWLAARVVVTSQPTRVVPAAAISNRIRLKNVHWHTCTTIYYQTKNIFRNSAAAWCMFCIFSPNGSSGRQAMPPYFSACVHATRRWMLMVEHFSDYTFRIAVNVYVAWRDVTGEWVG